MMVSLGRGVTLRLALGVLLAGIACASAPAEDVDGPVTFCEHIAPILWEHCASCHRPGEVGLFPLLTYRDAAKRAKFLAEITHVRRMPPWKPEPGFGHFKDVRRLSEDQIDLFARWLEADTPRGDPAKLPERPEFAEGWQLGEPDLVVKMSQPFDVPAGGRDVYRCFVIPLGLEQDRMVSAVEFRPGNRAVVHHSIMFLDATGEARKLDGRDGKPGYRSFGGAGVSPTGGLGAWLPGTVPRHLPEGFARYVRKDSDLVLQVHYHPTGKPECDQSQVGIHFAKPPVEKIITGIAITQPKLVLPAGDPHCVVRASTRPLPVDVNVLGVSPHMHYLGREFKVAARLPDGQGFVPLIWIKDWDVNWQGSYELAEPVRLPKGTVICVQAIYDNSENNPQNPNHPPKEVRWGEQVDDEMCLCGVQIFTDEREDLAAIAEMPGFELAAGLEGGVPLPEDPAARARALARRRKSGGIIPVFQKESRLMIPYDTDKNGWLSREEMSKMSGPMQSFLLRKYYRGRRTAPE